MLCIRFLLYGDVALILFTGKVKFHDKKQAIQCIVQYIKFRFQSKYCGGKSTVEMQRERTVAGIHVSRC